MARLCVNSWQERSRRGERADTGRSPSRLRVFDVLRPYTNALRSDFCGGAQEEGLEDLGAVVEDAADVGGYEEGVDQRAAEDGVVDVVGDLGAVVLCDEAMLVAPEAIWAA